MLWINFNWYFRATGNWRTIEWCQFVSNWHVKDICEIKFTIDDAEAAQKVQFILSGKTAEHTKIDDQGNIIEDAMIKINSVTIDGIDVDQLFIDKTQYNHDFNSTQPAIVDRFYGFMGCNGVLTFEFSTPIYLWLLENM